MCSADEEEHDAQHENNLICQQYFLLYEELLYGMNHGDIDRIESCFVPWIMIFAGCGKHKYAAELQWYLEDVHFRYPPGLNTHPIFKKRGLSNLAEDGEDKELIELQDDGGLDL
ncbi:hypothetical protein BDN71DRAFT_1548495 [Pleurotus eryngii]|uniref:DUF6589 domain-containing protein n=1 Tax=Pleurotus eryngii TaxID=5323 RepID=A0A9P5ZZC5_PLEER|nr:hypothetical protein BDN71DRAFT_1548495 [Pleurotus eryngii]